MYLLVFGLALHAQNKMVINLSNPSSIHQCTPGDFLRIEVRNISTSSLGSGTVKVTLPTDMEYASGSLLGSGIAESNLSDLSAPIFSFASIGLASAINFRIRVKALCGLQKRINSGSFVSYKVEAQQGSSKAQKTSTPLNILQPSLQISSIVPSLNTLDAKDTFVRKIVLANRGNGKLCKIALFRITGSGLQWQGSSPKMTKRSGDTIWHILDSQYFKSIGNKDIYFDKNEEILLRDSFQQKACDTLEVSYRAIWYCEDLLCGSQNQTARSQMSTKSPRIKTINGSSTTPCFDPGRMHQQSSILVNYGNDTARNLSLFVRQASTNMLSEIATDSFYYTLGKKGKRTKISKVKVLNLANRNGIFSCLSNQAVAAVEIELPNLNTQDSLYIYWHTRACVSEDCNAAFWSHRWYTQVSHEDQCAKTINEGTVWGSYGYYQAIRFTKLAPTDIKPSRDAELNYEFNSGRLITATSRAKSHLDLVLDAGLSHSLQAGDFQFIHQNGTSWSPNKLMKKGDTIRAVFYGAPQVTLNRGELKIKLKGNCKNWKNQSLKYKIQWRYQPDSACVKKKWFLPFCDEDNIKLHCALSCKYGLHFNDFVAERISFGRPDNNSDGIPDSTGSLDQSKVKKKRIMYGDTLKATFRGKVYANSFGWTYGQAISEIRLGKFLDVQTVRAKIYRSNVLYYNATGIRYSQSTNGQNRTFVYDLSYAGLTNGGGRLPTRFKYQNGDSIEIEVLYIVNGNYGGNIGEMEFDNRFFVSTVSNPPNNQRYQCDTFSERLNLVGYYFTNWGPNTYNNSGCKDQYISQNFYLGLGPCCSNYAGNDIFPYEYRNWAQIEKVIVHLPPGFSCTEARMWHYGTKGIGSIRTQYKAQLFPDTILPNHQVVFDLDSLFSHKGGDFLLSDDGFHGVFQPKIVTNCVANAGINTVNYSFVFRQKNQLGKGLDTIFSSNSPDRVNIEKATVAMLAQVQEVNPSTDTAVWIVSVSNSNRLGLAEKLFFGLPKSSGVELLQIKDLSTKQVLKRQNDIFIYGSLGAQTQKQFEVKVKFSGCSANNFDLLAGWDCAQYPDSLSDYDCQFSKVNLAYKVLNTRLEIALNDSNKTVDLCSMQSYVLELSNVGKSNVYSSFIDIYLQPGMELSDSLWLFYKSAQDSSLVRNAKKIATNVYRFALDPYDSLLKKNGLENIDGQRSSAKLKFKINTNCNFISGSFFMLRPGGYLKCGLPVYAGITAGKPIEIKGVKQPYYSSIKFTMSALDACNYQDNTTVKFLNLGPDSTSSTDKILFTVPKGFYINPSKTVNLHNGVQKIVYDTSAGNNRYLMDIPLGLAAGDSSHFQLSTYLVSEEMACGQVPLYMQAVVMQSVTCVKNNTQCKIFVNTSDQFVLDSVKKSVYDLQFTKAISQMKNGKEMAQIDYKITNRGVVKEKGIPLGVRLVYDRNKNGRVDDKDSILMIDTIGLEIKKNQTLNRQMLHHLYKDQACHLLLYIDAKSCLCEETTEKVGTITLKNVRSDTTICSYDPLAIGLRSPEWYRYTWNDTLRIDKVDSSLARFTAKNLTTANVRYLVKLETNRGDCKSVDSAYITVFPAIVIDMKDTADMCQGFPIRIGNVASGGVGRIKKYQWTPQDSLSDPYFTRPYANIHTSKKFFVSVTDPTGCYLYDSVFVRVNKNPKAQFDLDDACVGQWIEPKNTSQYSNSLSAIVWKIGKDSFTSLSPKTLLDSAGKTPISLWFIDNKGCQDSIQDTIKIYEAPKPQMRLTNDCQFQPTSYFATTSFGGPLAHYWRIQNDSIAGDTLHTKWMSPGQKEILLASRIPFGCEAYTLDTLVVYPKPKASYVYEEKCFGDSIHYLSQSTSMDSLTKFVWRLNGQIFDTSQQLKIVHRDTGKFLMSLEVQTQYGCKDTFTQSLDVFPLPLANFSVANICLGDTLEAYNLTEFPRKKGQNIQWLWGQQTFNDSFCLKLIPKNAGQQELQFFAENQYGCTDTVAKKFWVKSLVESEVEFLGNCENESFAWEANPQPKDSFQSLAWIFQKDTSRQLRWQRKLPAGNYQVKLITEAKNGCFTDTLLPFELIPKPSAMAKLSFPCADNLVRFVAQNQKVHWDLGDGQFAVLDSFEYAYLDTGTYQIKLAVEDAFGCKDTLIRELTIKNKVQAEIGVDSLCEGNPIEIKNRSTGLAVPITKSIFDLGDGNQVSNKNQFWHTYAQSGKFLIELNFETLPNCKYTTSKTVEIYPLPVPGFDFSPKETDILNANIQFINKSSGATQIEYKISDGSFYPSEQFSHQFKDSGDYTITQILTTEKGCSDSLSKNIRIHFLATLYIPNAFSPNFDGINEGFKPYGMGIQTYQISIFNRWGQRIFDGQENEPWTGKNIPLGTYRYQIKIRAYNGDVNYRYGTLKLLR